MAGTLTRRPLPSTFLWRSLTGRLTDTDRRRLEGDDFEEDSMNRQTKIRKM